MKELDPIKIIEQNFTSEMVNDTLKYQKIYGFQIGNNNQPLLNARIHYLGEIYTATFVLDGEVYATEKFTATQESIHEPDVPEKPGYTGSWSPYILNEQDITIEAIYKQITYYATIIADGATIAKIPFVYGQKSITLPDVPKKEGHTGAWPTYTLPANDITIEAIYKPNDYAVTFYCDDAVWTSGAIPYGGPVWQPRTPEKEGYTFVGWTPKIPDTMPAEDLTFTAVFEPITYYATFVADGAQVGEAIPFTVLTESITPPAVPEKPGYACAWEAFTLGIGDLTVNAVYTRLPTIQIKNFTATKNVDYKTTLTFTALATDVPDGAEIQWFVNNERAGTGETCKVEKATADYTVQAKLIGSDGSVLAESEIETVKVNTGFFAKLIAFFKGLFGSLPVITQAIKDTL